MNAVAVPYVAALPGRAAGRARSDAAVRTRATALLWLGLLLVTCW